jgi:excisionase family DNA binding protein
VKAKSQTPKGDFFMDITSGLTLTVDQVAERLSLSTRHVRDLLIDGTIHGFKRGKRNWGVLLSELEAFISRPVKTGKPGTAAK